MSVAAPGVSPERLFVRQKPGLHGIQMHIIAHRAQVAVATAIDDERLVSAAEEMAEKFVPPVEAAGVGAQKLFHPGDKVGQWRFEHEIKVILH